MKAFFCSFFLTPFLLTAFLSQTSDFCFGAQNTEDKSHGSNKANKSSHSNSPGISNNPGISNSPGSSINTVVRLDDLLEAEAKGQPSDRSELLLAPAENASPKAVSEKVIRWQAGELEIDGKWLKLSDLDESKLPKTLQRYRAERGDQPLDREGHRRMAKWCLSEKLTNQEKAHWFGVLETAPDDTEARRALGFAAIDGRWFSTDELQATEESAKEKIKAIKAWLPKVRDFVSGLESNDTPKRLKAIQQLKALKDPRCIPALQFAIQRAKPQPGLHLLNAMKRFQTKEACIALMAIAVNAPTTEVGQDAAVALGRFPKEMFVPALLDFMSTEKDLRRQLVMQPNGDLVLQLLEVRELKQHVETAQLDKVLKVNNAVGLPINFARRTGGELHGGRVSLIDQTITAASENEVAAAVSQNEAQRDAAAQQSRLAQENEATRQMQRNVATVLRTATGLNFDDTPHSWWNWWDLEQEILAIGNKEILRSYGQDFQSLVYSVDPQTSRIFRVSGSTENRAEPVASEPATATDGPNLMRPTFQRINPSARIDCLTAGTLIQSELGMRPIETIQVGDQVVSQNVTTGEIGLKPVVRITQRPISLTCNIILKNEEKIQGTLGHHWWVIGKGWMKTKDLLPGMHIRTATSSIEIERVETAPDAVTYNISVADHHSYFVGRERLLSFDSRELIPTLQKAPGLMESPLFVE